jgi:tRNA U34 2-thiouridine synthase MnmA/TrmU
VHQHAMRHAVFPLADLPKARVRELAAEMKV